MVRRVGTGIRAVEGRSGVRGGAQARVRFRPQAGRGRRGEIVREPARVVRARIRRAHVRARRVHEPANRDRDEITQEHRHGPGTDRLVAEPDRTPEGVVDAVRQGDPNGPARDDDAVGQIGRVAAVSALILGRDGGQGRHDPVRVTGKVLGKGVLGGDPRVGVGIATDQGVCGRKGRGISGVLEKATLAVEPPDVHGNAGGSQQCGEPEREHHEDLTAAGRAVPGHQTTLIS